MKFCLTLLRKGGFIKLSKNYYLSGAILHYIISILIGIFLLCTTRYAQNELHHQGADLYEFFFRFAMDEQATNEQATNEQAIPEVFFEEKEHVTLLCYERQNPMDYVLISGDETLVALEENYETVKHGEKNASKDTIFWAVSDRKKKLENTMTDWESALAEEGKALELCESRRITAAGLLGSKQYVYLLYGISWAGLLVFQIGNLIMYVKGKKKTAGVYFLLGIPGYTSKLKRNQIVVYLLLCLGELIFLKSYCRKEAMFMIILFYLLAVLWSVLYVERYIEKFYKEEWKRQRKGREI